MIRLNRTTEYGLMALRYMARRAISDPHAVSSAREISDHYALPFEVTAKTLQRLRDSGLILSAYGARGGYQWSGRAAASEMSLARFLEAMEGPQAVVSCVSGEGHFSDSQCEYESRCELRGVMSALNQRAVRFLGSIRVMELIENSIEAEGAISVKFENFSVPESVVTER